MNESTRSDRVSIRHHGQAGDETTDWMPRGPQGEAKEKNRRSQRSRSRSRNHRSLTIVWMVRRRKITRQMRGDFTRNGVILRGPCTLKGGNSGVLVINTINTSPPFDSIGMEGVGLIHQVAFSSFFLHSMVVGHIRHESNASSGEKGKKRKEKEHILCSDQEERSTRLIGGLSLIDQSINWPHLYIERDPRWPDQDLKHAIQKHPTLLH